MNYTQFIYHDLVMFVQSKQPIFTHLQNQQRELSDCRCKPFTWFMCIADFCYCNTLMRPPAIFHEQMYGNKTIFDNYVQERILQGQHMNPIYMFQLIDRMTHYNMITIEGYYLCKFLIDKFLESTHSSLTMENFWLIFLISIQIAMKFIEDCPFNNYSFGYVSSVNVGVINELEIFFLEKINYMINYEEFTQKHYSQLLI